VIAVGVTTTFADDDDWRKLVRAVGITMAVGGLARALGRKRINPAEVIGIGLTLISYWK
jgi:hypothetical protein